ncbi:MAG: hypothetical protein ACTSQ8_18910 [Candidatus Helarchaeota archaeon]
MSTMRTILLALMYDSMGNSSLYNNRRIVVEFSHLEREKMEDIIETLDDLGIGHGKIETKKNGRHRVRISKLDDVFTILSIVCGCKDEIDEKKLEKARAALALVKFLWVLKK